MLKYPVIIIIIILMSASVTSAAVFSPRDIEWDTAATGTLYKGGILTNGDYMVKAVQLASPVPGVKDIKGNIVPETEVEPSVLLEIYKNNVLVTEIIMTTLSEPYIDPDYEVKVSTTGFTARNAREWVYEYYNPSASVALQLRATPKIEITVKTDKTSYTSHKDQIITATVTVKNTGKAFARNVDVNLDTGGLKLRGGDASQLHKYYYNIDNGASNEFSVILVVPQLFDEKSYTLGAEASFNDVKEIGYKSGGSVSAKVSPEQDYFSFSKSVSKDRIYLTESVTVRITAANGGRYNIYNINITDKMSNDFELKSSSKFEWNIPVLEPGQEWGTTYSIKPIETNLNGFTLPEASAQFTVNNKQYSETSNKPVAIVNGPKIILNKTVDKPEVNISKDVTVTVTIKNEGNIATKAEVRDALPEGVSLVGGSTSLEDLYLEINKPHTITYTIRMDKEGNITLPAAVANYTGIGYKGAVRAVLSSEMPNVTVIDPEKTPVPTPAPSDSVNDMISVQTGVDQNESSFQKLKNKIRDLLPKSKVVSNENLEPTPVTPGFDLLYAVMVLVFYVVLRRKV